MTPQQFVEKVRPFDHVPGVGKWRVGTITGAIYRASDGQYLGVPDALAIVRDALRRSLPGGCMVGATEYQSDFGATFRSTDPVFDAAILGGLRVKPEPEFHPVKFSAGDLTIKIEDESRIFVNGRLFVPE